MEVLEYFNQSPFRDHIGMKITKAKDGYAEGHLPLQEYHSSNRNQKIAQGGVTFTLADSVGGAAIISLEKQPTPTIDFRIDYLEPATSDLYGIGEVIRRGKDSAVVDVTIHDKTGTTIAIGRGIYKISQLSNNSPWTNEQSE